MPGSGVGGLFYFCLVVWMPVAELWNTVRGRSSWAAWRKVAFYWSILGAILLALWGEAWVLGKVVAALKQNPSVSGYLGKTDAGQSMFLEVGQFAALWSVMTLALIVLFAAAMKVVVGVKKTPRAA